MENVAVVAVAHWCLLLLRCGEINGCSVARLGGFPPNWATFKVIGLEKIALGGNIKFGLVFNMSGGFLKASSDEN